MPNLEVLSQDQLELLLVAIRFIQDSPGKCGEVRIIIKDHHPRFIVPSVSLDMGKPALGGMSRVV